MCQVAGKETSKPCAPPACSDVKVPCMGRWRSAQYVPARVFILFLYILDFRMGGMNLFFLFAKVVCFQT